MKHKILTVATATAVAALVASTSGCSGTSGKAAGSTPAVQTITFGYTADFAGSAALSVAAEQGLWAKAGLKVNPKVFTNGPLQITAMGAGDLDFGYIGPGALWLPASGKADVIAINTLGLADRVIAAPDSGIKTAADLKGKKVAVPAGTSGDMLLDLTLDQAGLKPADVTRVTMDPSTVVTAFSSGQVQAAALWYPLVDTIKAKVPNLVEVSQDADFSPKLSFPSAFVTEPSTVAKDPELVKKVISVLSQADDWVAGHEQDAVGIDAAFLKVPETQVAGQVKYAKFLSSKELVSDTDNGAVADWLNGLGTVFVHLGKLPSRGDAAKYYTGDLYKAAAK